MDSRHANTDSPENDGSSNGAPTSPGESFHAAMSDVRQFSEFASYFLATKLDALKASVRSLGIYATLGVVAMLVAVSVVATAAVLLVLGIAGGLGQLFNHQWIADLITGVGILVVIGVVAWLAVWKLKRGFRQQTMEKYESRRREQQSRFGHDVHDVAGR